MHQLERIINLYTDVTSAEDAPAVFQADWDYGEPTSVELVTLDLGNGPINRDIAVAVFGSAAIEEAEREAAQAFVDNASDLGLAA